MSKLIVTDFSEPQPHGHPNDLLAQLYREIGISAVAAALDVMAKPLPKKVESLDERRLPSILRENIAA